MMQRCDLTQYNLVSHFRDGYSSFKGKFHRDRPLHIFFSLNIYFMELNVILLHVNENSEEMNSHFC